MTKPKDTERITPAQEKSKGIEIKDDAVTFKGKASKLPTNTRKGKGKRPTLARTTITLDPNTPSWARVFCRAVHVFLANLQSTDLGKAGTTVPPKMTSDTDSQDQDSRSCRWHRRAPPTDRRRTHGPFYRSVVHHLRPSPQKPQKIILSVDPRPDQRTVEMAKSKVAGRSKPHQDRTKGITMSKDADTFRSKVAKLSKTCEKGKSKHKAFDLSNRVEGLPGLRHRGNSDKLGYNHCFKDTHVCKTVTNLTSISSLDHRIVQTSQVPQDVRKEVEVMPTTSTNTRRIEPVYLKDKAEKKKAASMKIVNTKSSPTETRLSTPTIGPSGIFIATVTHVISPGSSVAA
uniref:Uncharacterized protein n=1 Tax=Solanum tuberosum TaxID=4113 RepID=M1DWI7_SOLTU